MRKLTDDEIHKLSHRKNVQGKLATEFLRSVSRFNGRMSALMEMEYQMRVQKWNDYTLSAVREGIYLSDEYKQKKELIRR